MSRIRILFLILPLSFGIGYTQQPSYVNYTVNEGLPSNTVYYSLQDVNGYVWFGTDKGISRFNGKYFLNYTYKDGLTENEVFDIFQDSQKRIWFSGFNGKPSYYHNGKFFGQEIFLRNDLISNKGIGLKCLEDKFGIVYYITYQDVYKIFKGQAKKIENNNYLNSTLVYLQDSTVCLLSYSKDSVKIRNLSTDRSLLISKENSTISPRQNTKAAYVNEVLYFSNANELVGVNYKTNTIETYYQFELTELLQCIQRRSDSTLWLGTKNGLYVYNFMESKIEKKLFHEVSVSSIHKDSENTIWITSLNKGVFQVINENVEIKNSKAGIEFDNCVFLSVLDSNQIVIGSQEFKCAFIQQNKTTNILLPKHIGEGKIQSVIRDNHQQLYIATGNGFYKLSNDLKNTEQFVAAVADIRFTDTTIIIAQGNRLLLVPNNNANLSEILTEENIHAATSINLKVKRIFITKKNKIYVTGTFGVQEIIGQHTRKINDHFLLNTNIVDFIETEDGLEWFASSLNGIIVKDENQLYHLTTNQGLASDFITSLTLGDDGSVWVGTQEGLSRIKPNKSEFGYQIESYGKSSGLISEQINDVVFFQHELWVATNLGTCIFHEPSHNQNRFSPNLIIENIFIDGKPKPISDYYEISHDANRVKISYSGISMSSLNEIVFQYRIVSTRSNWTSTFNTELEYPSLETGTHIFEIKAIAANGSESELRRITFKVLPAFYQTWWFYIIIAIMFLILAIYFIRHRIHKLNSDHKLAQYLLKLENEKLENENKVVDFNRNLAELKQKALILHMNPHFIFNSINAINGFYASGDVENAKIYVNKFSKLLRSILDASQRKFILLREEIELLQNYLQLNQLRFNHKFTFEVSVSPNINVNTQYIPPMIIQPFVENAIIHGITPKDKKGHIKVFIDADNTYLNVTISDDGVGLTAANEKNKNRLHHSTGIKISADRIKIYAGSESTQSLIISETHDNQQQVSGTQVWFHLKLENLW